MTYKLKIDLWGRAQGVMSMLLGLSLLMYTIYHLVQGDRSIQSWVKLRQDIQQKQNELSLLDDEKKRLEHDVSLLRDEGLDTELLGEYLLKTLNYAPPHNWMILIPEEPWVAK